MKETKPFTYFLQWTTINKCYYGVRYAQGCNPTDLMTTYFSSSKKVKELITNIGLPDVYFVDEVFDNKQDAVKYEHNYLKEINAAKCKSFLNRTNGWKEFYFEHAPNKGVPVSEEQKLKISKTLKLKYKSGELISPNIGRKHSEMTKLKIRETIHNSYLNGYQNHFKGKQHTTDTKKSMSVSQKQRFSTDITKHPRHGKVAVYDVELSINVLVSKEDYMKLKNIRYFHPQSTAYKNLKGKINLVLDYMQFG